MMETECARVKCREVARPGDRFCSELCAWKFAKYEWQKKRRREKLLGIRVYFEPRVCEWTRCGNTFHPRRSTQRFCGAYCQMAYNRAKTQRKRRERAKREKVSKR